MLNTLLTIAAIVVPSVSLVVAVYIMLNQQFRKERMMRELDLRKQNQGNTLPIRLQAYERLALFLERIDYNQLIPRVRDASMTSRELQYALISTIREEFEHNLTQQIYVSGQLWRAISLCKDELIKVINLVGSTIPEEAGANVLSRSLFQYIIDSEEIPPTTRVLDILKAEVSKLL